MNTGVRKILGTIVIAWIIFNAGCSFGEGKGMNISKEKAIEVANNKAIELGYDISEMNIKIDKDHTEWDKYIKSGPISKYDMELLKKLEGKKYLIVHYIPKGAQFGGDLLVFIDENFGEIISVLQGM